MGGVAAAGWSGGAAEARYLGDVVLQTGLPVFCIGGGGASKGQVFGNGDAREVAGSRSYRDPPDDVRKTNR